MKGLKIWKGVVIMILLPIALNLGSSFCYPADMKVEDIYRHLITHSGLIKDAKFKEKIGPLGWCSVTYKFPNMWRYDYTNGDISIRIGRVGYYYSFSRKELRLQERKCPFFTSDDMVYILGHSDIKLIGKEKIGSSVTYVLEGVLKPTNKFYYSGRRKIKVWIDPEKWIILKAKLSDAEEKFVETYIVKKIQLINEKFWFPTEAKEVRNFEGFNLPGGRDQGERKFKDIQINTGISDDLFTFQVPKNTEIILSSAKSAKALKSEEEVPEKEVAITSKKQIIKFVILPLVGLVILLVLIVVFIKRRKRK